MAAAVIARQAAAVVHARALAALARAALVDDDEGDAFSCVRLLLTELAAALHIEPGRQVHQEAAAGQGRRSRAQRRREQRKRATRARFGASVGVDANAGGAGGEQNGVKDISLEEKKPPAQELTTGERLAVGDAIIVEKDPGAGRDAGVRTGVSLSETESAGTLLQCQQLLQQQQPEAGAEAPAPAAMEMTTKTNDEQQASAAPRVAAAAAMPHKRQAVAAGTAVGVAVGEGGKEGGKPPAGGEGTWTTVVSRRARRQERARLEGTACAAARKEGGGGAGGGDEAHGGGGDRALRRGRVSGRGGGRGVAGVRARTRIALGPSPRRRILLLQHLVRLTGWG